MSIMYTKILNAAYGVASLRGLSKLTRLAVARRAGVALGTVSYQFGTMATLRHAVVETAISQEDLPLIAAAIMAKHPLALKLTKTLRERALLTAA